MPLRRMPGLVRPPQGGVAVCGQVMNDAPPCRSGRQGIADVPERRCMERMA
jgi:ABC-type branched-subunit amino acid transport system ATPase component